MNGAEAIFTTAAGAGIEICFTNPGTTEMPFVKAFDSIRGIRPVLGLFEGVCTGAADGYGRIKGKPAMTLLHLGPGLANGVANLHNARRARTPIVNIIGDHPTWHVAADAPLTMDIEGLSKTFSGWEKISGAVGDVSRDMAAAIQFAKGGRIATLIVPHDIQLAAFPEGGLKTPDAPYASLNDDQVATAAKLLLGGKKTAIIMDGRALSRRGLLAANHIKEAVGCDLISVAFPSCLERGGGLPVLQRIPYYPENAFAMLAVYDTVILADAHEPVSFFGYPGHKGRFLDVTPSKLNLISDGQDVIEALERLASHLPGPDRDARQEPGRDPELPVMRSGVLTPGKFCAAVAHIQPENAIIVDEGTTSTSAYYTVAAGAKPHTYITLTGGAIGMGMPCATGAAIAAPERPVISLQSDGSAMYTLQALWTQAREHLDVTTLLCANRKYRILQEELKRAGYLNVGEKAQSMTDLGSPSLDWVRISEGLGVPAVSVNTTEGLVDALKHALIEEGPHLIEMLL